MRKAGPMLQVADDFWNVRGSFRVGGVIDVGTHVSLVRRASGKFVFLDSYSLSERDHQKVLALTRGARDLEAILNVHPFHTVHVRRMHELYPNARLYGTARHRSRFPELPWEEHLTENSHLHEMFTMDFEFSVPRGVYFVSTNEKVHFSSVLVFHPSSKTIHVDDTLMCIRIPRAFHKLGLTDVLRFHPTLSHALERRAGAVREFREWARDLAANWGDARNLCAAHTATLTGPRNQNPTVGARILDALEKSERTLRAHERRHG